MRIVGNKERFAVSQPGIETRHCFSAGPHYDASRLGVGAVLAVDEHVLAPGAGFGEHAHRGVDIVSWVVTGVLRHNDGVLVRPGQVLVQRTGSGIRHTERNGSGEPLRLIQMTLLSPAATTSTSLVDPPVTLDGGRFDVHRSGARFVRAQAHLFVVDGRFRWDTSVLDAGDSAAVEADGTLTGTGTSLVWELV